MAKKFPGGSNKAGVKNAYRLFVQRPNPLQSAKEFNYERAYMYFTFGNNYVYLNNPLQDPLTLTYSNVQTMINLPSEFITVRQTGKYTIRLN